MSDNQIRLGDVGTRFLYTVKDDGVVVDLSTATVLSVIFVKPSGESISKTLTLMTDGTDGQVYYDSESGLLDEVGLWKAQGSITLPTGFWKTDISTFRVYPNLA